MSEPPDLLFTDPTEAALADALDRAAPSSSAAPPAGGRCSTRSSPMPTAAVSSSRPTAGRGRRCSAAWWTDHRGVKHVRVCGGDTTVAGWHPHYSRLDDDLRPPLWHVFMAPRFASPGEARGRACASSAPAA